MKLSFIAAEAADSLASNTRHSLLAALGLMVGVAAVVCVLAAGSGLRSLIVKEMGSFGRPTHLQIMPNYRYLSSTGWVKNAEPITDKDREQIASLTDLITGVSPCSEFQFAASYGQTKSVARLVCVSSDYFQMERLKLDLGRNFNQEDDRSLRRAAILGSAIAEKFFGTPGSSGYQHPIGKRIRIGSFGEVEIVGLLEREPPSLFHAIENYDSTNNGTIFVPYSAVRRFGGSEETYELYAEASSERKVEEAQRAILAQLSLSHGLWDGEQKFIIETGKSALSEVNMMTALITNFVAAVAGISLIVAGIGVMNVMLISVKERTREIGTRKALGSRGSWIGSQFLIESLVVCLSGGFAGVLLATLTAEVVSRIISLPTFVPKGAFALSLILSALVALAFGWLPARRASKLDPCEALRHE